MDSFNALVYSRGVWDDVPPSECWDVEETLNCTGASVWHPDTRKLVPVYSAWVTVYTPWVAPRLVDADGRPYDPDRDTLIRVAPGTRLVTEARTVLADLAVTEATNIDNARVTLLIKGVDANSGAIDELVTAIKERQRVPVIKAASEMDPLDVVRIGDGDTHVDETQRAYAAIVARMCQQLGVHYNDTQKAERLVVDEVEGAYDAVEVIRANEIRQRQKLAKLTGWRLVSLYGVPVQEAVDQIDDDVEQLTIEEVTDDDNQADLY